MNNLLYHIIHSDRTFLKRRSGFDDHRLNQIGQGSEISYSELVSFSRIFELPISTLLAEHSEKRTTSALFRKQFGSPETQALVDKIGLLIDGILRFSPSRSVDLSRIGTGVNALTSAEDIARNFRKAFLVNNQLDAILELPELLANLGVVIQIVELGDKVDGSCARVEDVNFIFLSPRFPSRMLMSLAHELGHLINHIGSGSFIIIEPNSSNKLRSSQRSQEDFANHFASSLLLPTKGVAHMISSMRRHLKIDINKPIGDIEIIHVAHFYGLSFEATAQRLEILGLIPKGGAYSLSNQIKKGHGSAEKRARELNLTERESINFKVIPKTLLENVFGGLENGDYSIGQVCQALNLTVGELNNLHQI